MSVINQRGELEEAYAYDEFGQEYGNIIDARDRFQPLSYTGYQKEAVGDTYFAQARRYDASIGRFVSEDKIQGDLLLPTSLNAYVYCWNRPKDYVDLNGLWPEWIENNHEILGLGLTVAGIAAGVAITIAFPVAGPFMAGAVTGLSGYMGEKLSEWEKPTFAGAIVSTGMGGLSGFLPGAGATKNVSNIVGKKAAQLVIKDVAANSMFAGAEKAMVNLADGEKMHEDLLENIMFAGIFSGIKSVHNIKVNNKMVIKSNELKNQIDDVYARFSKWNNKYLNAKNRSYKSKYQSKRDKSLFKLKSYVAEKYLIDIKIVKDYMFSGGLIDTSKAVVQCIT